MNHKPDKIKARLDAATPGPWEMRGDNHRAGVYSACEQHVVCGRTGALIIAKVGDVGDDPVPNANFIANAPTDIVTLLAENAGLRAILLELSHSEGPYTRDVALAALQDRYV